MLRFKNAVQHLIMQLSSVQCIASHSPCSQVHENMYINSNTIHKSRPICKTKAQDTSFKKYYISSP